MLKFALLLEKKFILNCNNCNQSIPANSNYCSNCGAKIIKDSGLSEKTNIKATHINPLFIIAIAGVLAILAVILILDSNAPEKKLTQQNNQSTQESSELFSKINSLKSQINNAPDNVNLNIELGNNLFDVKKYKEAIPYYRKALQLSPENVEVRIDLAVSYYNIKEIDTALIEINKALELNPHHQQGLYNLGVMYYNSGDREKAKKSWDKLIELHDGSQAAETAKQLLQNI